MPTVDALNIRRRLGRGTWGPPVPFGPDGFAFDTRSGGRIIVTAAAFVGRGGLRADWVHASISHPTVLPTYRELLALRAAVWPHGHAYQVFVPTAEHVNLHPTTLHLWGRADGTPELPDFGRWGSI